MLREDVRHLDGILMTHAHKDHTAGMDDIRSFNFINRKAVDIYCDEATEAGIREQFSYAFQKSDYPYLPRMNFIRIGAEPFRIGDLEVVPFEVYHGYMPVKGFRFGEATYITDAKKVSEAERKKIRGTKTLVVNALRFEDHYSHFTIDEAIEFAKDMEAKETYFTHMSHQFGLHAETALKLPPHIHAAFDGLKITV
jgi:phosphoribosyl 1,2-cyclic phosphate phosphodiesterase